MNVTLSVLSCHRGHGIDEGAYRKFKASPMFHAAMEYAYSGRLTYVRMHKCIHWVVPCNDNVIKRWKIDAKQLNRIINKFAVYIYSDCFKNRDFFLFEYCLIILVLWFNYYIILIFPLGRYTRLTALLFINFIFLSSNK